ncbi:MAG: DUF4935 domain-containing protein [Planctomycetaceae bacterium]|nr:DUF4935 domain-containing protein [Planctomycetaceae bacterium]
MYRVVAGRQMLDPLREVSARIFITSQIVDEVQRNKLDVASRFLKCQLDSIGLKSVGIPTHLLDGSPEELAQLQQKCITLRNDASNLRKELQATIDRTLTKISRSEDDVSLALAGLFGTALWPSCDELKRAFDRKQRGNPPGKKNDPLGDQITWEQFLDHSIGRPDLWIISNDSDYLISSENSVFLNPFLQSELQFRCGDDRKVYCFNNLVAGIRHFVEKTGIGQGSMPTPEQLDELERQFIANHFCSGLWLSTANESHPMTYSCGQWTCPLGSISITKNRVTFEGITYPIQSLNPFWVRFCHNGTEYEVTE